MAVELNHTIVHAADARSTATWMSDVFGFDAPERFGHFWQVTTSNGVSLDFVDAGEHVYDSQHYAFLVSETEFDGIFGRVLERGLDHWADPGRRRSGEINHHDGGRGVYFCNPDGHFLEIITRPYGGGSGG